MEGVEHLSNQIDIYIPKLSNTNLLLIPNNNIVRREYKQGRETRCNIKQEKTYAMDTKILSRVSDSGSGETCIWKNNQIAGRDAVKPNTDKFQGSKTPVRKRDSRNTPIYSRVDK